MSTVPDFPEQPLSIPTQPRMVYVTEDPVWEYRRLARNLAEEKAPNDDELNALGAEGWELAGLFSDSRWAYFYFKRLAR